MSDPTYKKYLYAIMWPNKALVASMLAPDEFGKHYTIGSSRYFQGQVLFVEIDPEFRHDYFPIDKILEEVKPKPDGSPKRTKFISSYRVLEHLDFSAFGSLYVTSVEGKVLELKQAPYQKANDPGYIRVYQEICPLNAIVLTYLTPRKFGSFITDPDQPKMAPKLMFTQIDLNIDEFLQNLEKNPFHGSPIPNIHPHKLREQIKELKGNPHKQIKGISLDSAFGRISFLRLRTGFWFAFRDELVFYPIPSLEELERDHFHWLRSLDVQRF